MKKYPHPGLEASPFEIKLWEIRNQLEINLEIMIRDCPVDKLTMELFGHPLEVLNGHVFDRLIELETMIDDLSGKNVERSYFVRSSDDET